ncbi:hypothetical protein JCM10908_000228 [Rhodotorula pacifica]|uniref:cyclin family protein n=1 Tax=Rhodotorula pacifica TaxID=1495444 RepID=UPI00317492DD
MNVPLGYPSTFDGTTQPHSWNMVAPPTHFQGAHYDQLRASHSHPQASLAQQEEAVRWFQQQQQQQQVGAFGALQHPAAAYQAYNPAAYHQQHVPQQQQQYFPAKQLEQFYMPPAFASVEQPALRSRFAFAAPARAPAAQQYERFTLPPPAAYPSAHYGVAESAQRATLDSEPFFPHAFFATPLLTCGNAYPADDFKYAHHADSMMEEQAQPITYDLIPNISAVPPPPPVELSAVPLADLATEMVWEAVRQGYLHALETGAAAGAQTARAGPRRSGNGDQFGAIGDRRARTSSASGYESDATEDASARRQRLAELGFVRARASVLPVEPSAPFRQFVKQILTATLVTPEDIVMAMYLVSQIPVDKIIPPTPAEPGQDAQTTSFKAAPFKIVLGALMVANKTLQDNSYRNDTFSTVSGIPLPDVNALEAHVFLALGFDVVIREDKWLAWLGIVADRLRFGAGELGDRVAVQAALERLAVAAQREVDITARSMAPASPVAVLGASSSSSSLSSMVSSTSTGATSAPCPSTPVHTNAAYLADVNLDASGPLESPLHLVDARRRALLSRAASSLASSAAAQAQAQESPLVGSSSRAARSSCRRVAEASGYSLFPPVDLAASRSRSFGQETWSRAIC